MKDHTMIDYRAIEVHMKRARLERTAYRGEAIANAILACWKALKTAGQYLKSQTEQLTRTPDAYSTSLRRP